MRNTAETNQAQGDKAKKDKSRKSTYKVPEMCGFQNKTESK